LLGTATCRAKAAMYGFIWSPRRSFGTPTRGSSAREKANSWWRLGGGILPRLRPENIPETDLARESGGHARVSRLVGGEGRREVMRLEKFVESHVAGAEEEWDGLAAVRRRGSALVQDSIR